jgi:hypothetical protein
MSHKISIDFTGLCVFATKNVPDRLSVLLAGDPKKGAHHPADDPKKDTRHRPLLSFNVRNLEVFSGESSVEVIQLPDGSQIASWGLDGKIVTLTPGREALPKKVTLCGGGVPKSRFPQDPQAEMDLCWVPSLGRITGQDVDPVLLDKNPVRSPGPSALVARVDINHGFLFANAAVNRQQPASCWTIRTLSGQSLEQYLADTVRLEIDGQDGELLVFTATPFGGGPIETLALEPVDGRIALSITNLPEVLPDHRMEMASMDHFSAYYGLLDRMPKDQPVPTRSGRIPDTGKTPPAHHVESPRAHTMGPDTAVAEGIYPVKCSPGMLP